MSENDGQSSFMRRLRALAVLMGVFAATALPCAASDIAMFRSPTGGIGCIFYDAVLRCDVEGGIVPLPPQPKSCPFAWGSGFYLRAHGAASIVCAGDTSRDPNAPVVRYGSVWKRGGITCASSFNGMRCTNADGHGFTIARGEARRF